MTRLDNSYTVFQHKSFIKIASKNLGPQLIKILHKKIELLAQDPYIPGLNTKQVTVSDQKLRALNVDAVFEFRINMSFRCVFYVREADKIMILVYCGNHEAVRKHLK